jgi:excisionase family DNA binding protein
MTPITRHCALSELPELLTVAEASAWLGVGLTLVYELVRSGKLKSVRLGRLVRIPRTALEQLVTQRQDNARG